MRGCKHSQKVNLGIKKDYPPTSFFWCPRCGAVREGRHGYKAEPWELPTLARKLMEAGEKQ